jgi:uncharacterized protein (TIGR02217 family)
MTAFHDVSFPTRIALGARGGPQRRTDIATLASGREVRNALWATSRRRWDIAYGIKTLEDLQAVIAFFEARLGRLHAFRFRDPFEQASSLATGPVSPTDQPLAPVEGSSTRFQLQKRYVSGGFAVTRPVTKPVPASVRVALDGVETTAFTLDALTGVVKLSSDPGGAIVTAGFRFDTPARFDTDVLELDLRAFEAGDIPAIPLLEVLP